MHHFSPGHLLIKTAVVPLLPRVVRQFVRRRARARVPYVEWINPDFARRIDLYARLIAEPPLSHVKGIGRQSIYDAFHNGSISIVLGMIDHADARLGLDARHPFFDQRLIEFAFALPNDQLRRDGFERYIVRNAMRGILPEIVRTRVTKGSFNQPILASVEHNSAFIRFDRLEIAERGWVNAAKLKSAFEALMASYRNGDGNYGFPVWMAIATEIWHRVVFGSGKFER